MKKENSMPNLVENEKEILKFWNENDIFGKLKQENQNTGKYYAFLDGPITANYIMGLHHAWNRSLKDVMLRFAGMNGCGAHYQNGFDAHGLPVELRVEKELGLNSKKEIEKYGVENFIEKCLQVVDKYSSIITEQSKRLGQWMDWDDSYYTNSDENITAIWHFLKVCHEKGWITEKYRPTPWCIRCGTALSEHEMGDADAYKEIEHTAVFFKLPVLGTNNSVVVWTTTPWTLSSNVAVAVNPEFKYSICKVKSDTRNLIVCSDMLKVLKGDLIEVVEEVSGHDLVGMSYETCFPEFKEQNFEHKIVAWDQVDSVEGSGMVHIAPGCGAEDFDLGQSIGLKNIMPIDEAGNFYEGFGFLSGKNANEVADLVFEELKARNKLYYTHKYKHRYPHCWRCKNPVLYRLVKNWVIKMDEIRPALIHAIDDVEFQPEFMKKRMLDWLNNMGDWSISRKRYYGVPLPIYHCPHCGKLTVVGSLEELASLSSEEEVKSLPHIHKPYIDKIKITCPNCGEKVERIPEVGDCWLDAGITPFSTKKYFSDKEFFEKNFPIEVVLEGKEQIRLWFYSLLVMSVALTGRAPYKKIVCTAMLLDRDGNKLSKSSPNNIPIDEAFEKIGADIVRYMFASNNMTSDVRFSFEATDEIRRKILGFWNNYVFFNTYATLDNPQLDGFMPDMEKLDLTDRWLLAKVNNFVRESYENYKHQRFYQVTADFEELSDELSNWYIRVNRRRFWKSDDEEDKLNAYYTLYFALKTICQVMSPIIPFLCEYIWQNMTRSLESGAKESIFLERFPMPNQKFDNQKLIADTNVIRNVIAIAQRLRNENQIKIKQPLKHLYVLMNNANVNALKEYDNLIKDELNIKEITFEEDNTKFNDEFLTVNFKTAGARLKGAVQQLKNTLNALSQDEQNSLVKAFKAGENVQVEGFEPLPADTFILSSKPKQDYVIASENGITCVLDITIDENLMLEGVQRELVRALQVVRKENDLKIEQRITLFVESESELINCVVEKFKSKIMQEILANKFENAQNPKIKQDLVVADENLVVKIDF